MYYENGKFRYSPGIHRKWVGIFAGCLPSCGTRPRKNSESNRPCCLIGQVARFALFQSRSKSFLVSSIVPGYGGGMEFLPRASARSFFKVVIASSKKPQSNLTSGR